MIQKNQTSDIKKESKPRTGRVLFGAQTAVCGSSLGGNGNPEEADGFLDLKGLLKRVPVSAGTITNWRKEGRIPWVQGGPRRVLFHWPSVQQALLRMQRGGQL